MFKKVGHRVSPSVAPARRILTEAATRDVISFAHSMPASEMFPRQGFAEASERALSRHQWVELCRPFAPLKEHIVRLMAQRGVTCTWKQIVLTSGAQEGLNLLTRFLVRSGETVVTEAIVYDELRTVLEVCGARPLSVPTCLKSGMDVVALESMLVSGQRPAFLYTIPDGHNPLGVTMSLEKRCRLVEIAHRFRLPVVEDGAYGSLCYDDGPAPAPLRALDDRWVFYVGSFSKLLAPSLRVGWVVVPEELSDHSYGHQPGLSPYLQAANLNTATLAQQIVSAYLDSGDLPRHIEAVRREYRRRRDAMLSSIDQHFGGRARCGSPASGLSIWLELEAGIRTEDLLAPALDAGVAFLPGRVFAMDSRQESSSHSMRLSFANCAPEKIDEGVARLERVVEETLNQRDNGFHPRPK